MRGILRSLPGFINGAGSAIGAFARDQYLRLHDDRHGAVAVIVALAATVLIGFTALAVETGLWYTIKRQSQSAADAAALSGAYELATGNQPYSDICKQAKHDASANGFIFDASYACPSATPSPACTSASAGGMCLNQLAAGGSDNGSIEVYLAQQQNTYLANLFQPSVTIGTHAVATVRTPGYACAGALSKTATKAVNFSGNSCACFGSQSGACSSTCTASCGIFSNSDAANSINFQGSTTLTATSFQAVGNYNTNGNALTMNVPTKLTDSAPITDPYSCSSGVGCAGTITWPTISGSEKTASSSGGTSASPQVLTAGTYKGASNAAPMIFTSGVTTLCPGVYVLDGEDNSSDAAFQVSSGATVQMGTAGSGGCPTGTINGVTLLATSKTGTKGGGFDISSGATVTLSAPTTSPQTGIPSGLLFAQDPTHADTHANGNGKEADSTITANSNTALKGALYTPATNFTFQGNSNSTCFLTIALTVTFSGDSNMSGSKAACKAAGVTGPAVTTIALTQ